VSVTQGVLPFTYLWDNGSTTTTATGLGVGWQHVTITDGCGPKVDSVLVTSKPILQVSLSTQNILLTCASDLGSATVITQDGALPFIYTWDDGVFPNPTRNDLDTGWHYVTVTDVCNNPFTGSVRVNHLPEVFSTATLVAPASCPAGGNGEAIANASSGVPPYTYAWSNSVSTSSSANDLLTGWQYVTVSDYCTSRVDSVEVTSQPLLSTAITASTPTNCTGAFNGSATVTASNGGGSYTYLWTGGETTATAVALGEGWNYVTVTDFCSTTKLDSVEIAIQSALTETVTMTTQANCPASSEGVAMVNVTSGAAPFFYNWTSGNTTAIETGLSVGWHYVTITDGCGDKLDSVEITNKPVLQVSLSTQSLLLTCASDLGTVTVLTQDGVAPFTYTWDDGVVLNPTRNNLGSGWHFVTVTDVCNIPYEDSVRVNFLPQMMIDGITSQMASCSSGGDGYAHVVAESGVPPYTYVWSNSASTMNTATDLLTGWQYVTVSDYCISKVDSIEIFSLPVLEASITAFTNVNCAAGTDGSATVTATNGGLPYTYIWTSGETTATAVQLSTGWNYITISDVCGTIITDSIETAINPVLQINSIQVSPTTCPGGNNGSATVNYSGGSAPITFLWSDASTNQTATGLLNETVFVTVTDACGSLSTSADIDFLPQMQISITTSVDASCASISDGKAFVTALNGSGVYTYQWSNSASVTATVVDLPVGWNYVTVTDACGSLVDSVDIGIKTPLDGVLNATGLATCPNSTDGVAVAIPMDGVPPYSYAWSGSADTDSIASDLPVGSVSVTITDACGSIVRTINVTSQPAMTYTSVSTNLLCFNDSSGTMTVTPSLGVPPYTYVWADTILTDSMRTDLHAGTYYVTISDACASTTHTFILQQPGDLSITLLTSPVQFQGETTGQIDVIVSGGSAPYYYNWSNGSLIEDQNNLAEGTYLVTVSDNNGCFTVDSSDVVSLSSHIIVYSAFTPNDDGKNDVWNIKYINNFPECVVSIYNEWGIVVFESTGYETPWDGTKSGSPLPAGSYYYVIDLKDGSEAYTGSVTLMK
jgi:gliding motility-associated-like protein